MAVCRGCGAVLQTTDPKAPGYTPKEGSSYCQRCFRLMHYDDLTISMRTGIDPDMVMNRLADMDVLILWTVDLFDFEAGMIPGLSRKLAGKDLILICTKRDLLPDTLNHEKIARFVFSRLKEAGIHIRELILTSGIRHEGKEEIMEAVHKYADGRKVAVMGRANSGKSTLLNELAGSQILASSRYPGTTLDFNELEIDGIPFIDTPGIEIQHSMLMDVKEEDLKTIIPARTIKPQIYQVRGNQSFAAGGLARLDVSGADHAPVAWYLSDRLDLHRGKAEAADELWQKHYGELLKPVPLKNQFHTLSIHKHEEKTDVVFDGLGWACVSGNVKTITAKAPESVNITFRKAML